MNELVTVIFDANGGGITVSSKRVTRGEPYGALPPPARFGYEFDGWFTAEEGGERVDAETTVTAEQSHALYAHWTKQVKDDAKLNSYKKKKASLKKQKTAIAVAVVLVVLVIIGLCGVAYLVNRTNLEDVDGTVYKIINRGGTYVLCDAENELELDRTEDGKYYITAAGSQIKLDASTGKASIYAYVDTVGREVVGNVVTSRLLAFPQVEKKNMKRLEIHNDYGTYAFIGSHTASGDSYYIEGHKNTSYDQEQFASLVVSCGYVLAMSKIEAPVVDEDGGYSEYGLVSETRTDAAGNEYDYTPAWYELTDINNTVYRVIVGDKTVSGGGYYVQYLNPDHPDTPFIYIVNVDIEKTVLSPVEALVEPMIVYPMTLTTYFNVENFTIMDNSDSDEALVSFTYIPLEERQGTMLTTVPYVFGTTAMKAFRPHSTNVDTCLQSFYTMEFLRVVKLAPGDEELIEYGLADAAYAIYYKYLVTEEGKTSKIDHYLLISKMTESGTYYVYSGLFDMIVEVERRYLPFLEYGFSDWVDEAAYSFNLGCTDEISLQRGTDKIVFDIDNSNTEQYKMTALSGNQYTATDYYGEKTTYHLVKKDGKYRVATGSPDGDEPEVFASDNDYFLGKDGKLYLVRDRSQFTVDTSAGTNGRCRLYVTSYDKAVDSVLYIFVDENTGAWGLVARNVGSGDAVVDAKVNGAAGKRLTTQYFRHFFQTILYASMEGECRLTEAELEAFRALPDDKAELVMTVSTEMGDYVFRFYRYTERKSYVTINGEGSYYMISDRVEKIWSDANKIIAGEDVSATSKN